MYISLLVLGLALAIGGAGTLAFGIPINAFSLGNTLIIAGIMAMTGGFLLIGLAVAVRTLRRILDVLQVSRIPGISVPAEAAVETPAPRLMPIPVARPSESLDWMKKPPQPAEQSAPVVADEAPLSPGSPLATMAEPVTEPKAWSPRRPVEPPPIPPRAHRIAREKKSESRAERGRFDAMWPASRTKTDESSPEETGEAAPPPVEVLKSGVIDGMAYTLYADGSIEAQLAQGTMRFESVDALRAHIDSDRAV